MNPKKMKRHFGINGSHKYCRASRNEGAHFHNREEEKHNFQSFSFHRKDICCHLNCQCRWRKYFARNLNPSLQLSPLCACVLLCVLYPIFLFFYFHMNFLPCVMCVILSCVLRVIVCPSSLLCFSYQLFSSVCFCALVCPSPL